MLDVRSRAGIMAVTTGAALLLALPVVAAGQAPNVGDVVGGVKDRVPAPPVSVPAPPVQLPPQASPPAPAPRAQNSPPPRSPSAQPPPEAPPSSPPAHGRTEKPANPGGGGGEPPGQAPSPSQNEPASSQGGGSGDGGSEDGDSRAGGDGGGTKGVSQEGGNVPTDVEIADQVVEAPVDASPSTLPFTGFQLALMVALGLAAMGTGFALRRGARSTG